MSVTIAIILDTRRIKQNKKYPVKLRVNYLRVSNYYPTIFDLSQDEYDKLGAPRISAELQKVRKDLKSIESDAESLIGKLEPFTFSEFEKRFVVSNRLFRQRKSKQKPIIDQGEDFDFTPFYKQFPILLETSCVVGTIAWSYKEYIRRLLREGRIGTAVNYHCSYVSIKKFRGNVKFTAITASYLIAYEQKLNKEGLSKSTIGIYLRPLRALYNEAAEAGLVKKDQSYPFGRRKYRIPTARKNKKALDLSDVEKIYYYDENNLEKSEQRSRAYWLFSYFGNGINPKDIAGLKYNNVHEDYLIFERAKTERSLREDPMPITVYINDDMKAIIARWGNKPISPHEYIFPVLHHGVTPLRQYRLIQNMVHAINNCMEKVLADLGINKKVTTYVARHTFSTVLKKSGASTEQIQEALGHTNIKTTESYLDSFDKETKKQLASRLTSFKRRLP